MREMRLLNNNFFLFIPRAVVVQPPGADADGFAVVDAGDGVRIKGECPFPVEFRGDVGAVRVRVENADDGQAARVGFVFGVHDVARGDQKTIVAGGIFAGVFDGQNFGDMPGCAVGRTQQKPRAFFWVRRFQVGVELGEGGGVDFERHRSSGWEFEFGLGV